MSVNYRITTAAGLSRQLHQTRQSIRSWCPFSLQIVPHHLTENITKYHPKPGTKRLIRHDQCALSRRASKGLKRDGDERWRGREKEGYLPGDWDALWQAETSWGADNASLIDNVTEPRQHWGAQFKVYWQIMFGKGEVGSNKKKGEYGQKYWAGAGQTGEKLWQCLQSIQ